MGEKIVKIHSKVFSRVMYAVGDELAAVFNFDALFSLCECLYSISFVYSSTYNQQDATLYNILY
jgi:hypothetical protein